MPSAAHQDLIALGGETEADRIYLALMREVLAHIRKHASDDSTDGALPVARRQRAAALLASVDDLTAKGQADINWWRWVLDPTPPTGGGGP